MPKFPWEMLRPGSKYPNWQRSQRTSYKTKFSQRYNIYLVDHKYNITWQNIQGETKVRPISIPRNAQNGNSVTWKLTWMSFLQNREVCFNQESLPITYHIFRHKGLVTPKIKSPNWQGSQPIISKTKLSQRDNIHLEDHKYNILTKISGEKLR